MEDSLRKSIKILHTRIDIVLQLHKRGQYGECIECTKYASFKVPHPCKTAVLLGEV